MSPYRDEELSVEKRCELALQTARERFASEPARESTYQQMCTAIVAYLDGYGIVASVAHISTARVVHVDADHDRYVQGVMFKIQVYPRIKEFEITCRVSL